VLNEAVAGRIATFERMQMQGLERGFLGFSGLFGVAGVVSAAMAAHGAGGETLQTASQFLLFHAAALLGFAGLGGSRGPQRGGLALAGLLLILGVTLFAGDLACRALLGERLFAFAAPAGGTSLILGWAVLAASALLRG
jgi:uncharacterized membrane protein YgdD (TMEM256/DUF423 family)